MSWRQRIIDEQVEPVKAALASAPVESISFDFVNCLVAITVPEDTNEDTEEELVAKARAATKAGAYVRHPAEYPFTLHLRGPMAPVAPAQLADGVVEVNVRLRDVASCQEVYEEVSRRAATADYVATFALGGLVPLQFVARVERASRTAEAFERDLRALQRKHHLFPGLLWEGGHGPPAFRVWLEGLPPKSSVLVFDTTFTGNAVNRIRNVLQDYADASDRAPELDVDVLGVLDLSRGKVPEAEQAVLVAKSGNQIRLSSEVLGVTNLLTEDRIDLVGYDSLRVTAGISAQWSSAVVLVEGDDGKLVQVIGTRSLASTFGELLDGRVPPVALDEPMVAMSRALAVKMVISEAARQERDELQRALRKDLVAPREYEDEMRRISGAEKGARKRYKKFFEALEPKG